MKKEMRKLSDLKANVFVRKELNADHVLYLADLIAHGVKMYDPIEITPDGSIINGRHRKEAYQLNDMKEVECVVNTTITDEIELIAAAYKANVGGSLPPSQNDTEHTVMLLLERGESKKQIGDLLGLPAGLARRYVNDVQSKMARAKLQRAATSVTDGGLTVMKAAEVHDVDINRLKEVLSGTLQRQRKGVADTLRLLTTLYKSLGQKNANMVRRLLEQYEDGDVNERQVKEVFAKIEHLQKTAARSINDWKKRFQSMTNGNKASKTQASTSAI